MSGDHLERLEAALNGAHRVHHALGEPHPSMVLVDEPDLRAALDELKQLRAERTERDFRWEEWAVQLHFPGGLTTVEHDSEDEARDHYRRLLKEPAQRAERIEVVRRVMVQGAYVAAPQQPERGGSGT